MILRRAIGRAVLAVLLGEDEGGLVLHARRARGVALQHGSDGLQVGGVDEVQGSLPVLGLQVLLGPLEQQVPEAAIEKKKKLF